MPSDITVDVDKFAFALDSILEGIRSGIDDSLTPCVRKACQKGAREERKNAKAQGLVKSGRYVAGISYTTKGNKNESFGEIGNRNSPGLAHLLEKGHATAGGGRVAAYPHIAPAAVETFKKLEEELDRSIEDVLRS